MRGKNLTHGIKAATSYSGREVSLVLASSRTVHTQVDVYENFTFRVISRTHITCVAV